MNDAPWTVERVRALGLRTDLETAAAIWGIGRTRAYELAREGEFPSPCIRVRNTWVVPIAPLLRALGVDEAPEEQRRLHVGAGAETILSLAQERTDVSSVPPSRAG